MAEDFFLKIFPDEEIRRYFLAIQSEIFVGRNQRKIFQIWTGVGDNGKSITQEIFEKMLGEFKPNLKKKKTRILSDFEIQQITFVITSICLWVYNEFNIDKNIDFIYEISETNSGEVVLWKP